MIEGAKTLLLAKTVMTVRLVSTTISMIDVQGEVSAFAERPLRAAYYQAVPQPPGSSS